MRVLLVDDEETFLDMMKFFLQREQGLVVDTAASAKAALEMLTGGAYDALISDYQMPDMDGIELLKIIRAKGQDMAFVLLTGKGTEDVAIEALNNGADFYLQKGRDPKILFTELVNMLKMGVGRRAAERSVRERERFLASVFASIQDGISVLTPDMVIMQVNPTVERWHANAIPLVGKKCYAAYHGRDSPCEGCPSQETMKTKAPAHRIVPMVREGPEKGGWLDLYTFPMIDDATRELGGVIEYARNVTDRTKAEIALRESEAKYRELVDQLTSIVMRVDRSGRITFLNRFGLKFFGYEEGEIVGKPVVGTIMLSDEVPQTTVNGFAKGTWASPGTEHIHEEECVCKDGRRVWVSWSGRPVLSPSGDIEEIFSVGNDITERKRQTEYLAQANRKMGLLGDLTRHDALNQLSVLVGWLDIALDSQPSKEVRAHLVKVKDSAESIRALLEFTGEYGKMGSAGPEWMDAKRIVMAGAEGLDLQGVRLECDLDGVEILGDQMVHRVFRNLIDNSIRHGQKVTRISCRYAVRGADLVLTYEDDGVGLSAESRSRIFERGIGDHTGYGLFMAREILSMTGITISETGLSGKGARFEIRTPKGSYRLRRDGKR